MKTMGEGFGGAQHVVFMSGLKNESLSKKAISGKGTIHGPLPNSQRNKVECMTNKTLMYTLQVMHFL